MVIVGPMGTAHAASKSTGSKETMMCCSEGEKRPEAVADEQQMGVVTIDREVDEGLKLCRPTADVEGPQSRNLLRVLYKWRQTRRGAARPARRRRYNGQ